MTVLRKARFSNHRADAAARLPTPTYPFFSNQPVASSTLVKSRVAVSVTNCDGGLLPRQIT
jgi:hypothetical protein